MREQPMAWRSMDIAARAPNGRKTPSKDSLHAARTGRRRHRDRIALSADFCPVLHHYPELPGGAGSRTCRRAELPPAVPTLQAASTSLPDIEWLLEIKTFPDAPDATVRPNGRRAGALEMLGKAPGAKVAIFAFDWSVLRAVAARNPALRRLCRPRRKPRAARYLVGPGLRGHVDPAGGGGHRRLGLGGRAEKPDQAEIDEAHELGLKYWPGP